MIGASKPSGFDPEEAKRLLRAHGKLTEKKLKRGVTLKFACGVTMMLRGLTLVQFNERMKQLASK